MQINVVLPNYNGGEMLAAALETLLQCAPGDTDVVVVDDASTDGSVDLLRDRFPDVRTIARTSNGGFSAAANDGIRATDGEFLVLLNNDVEVTQGFLDPILPLFADDSVFAVGTRVVTPSLGGLDDGAKRLLWHHGMFMVDNQQHVGEVKPVPFASGCAAVYRMSMLKELGGFDEAYSPFYWEDVDLCYRAWKRGWRSLYQPASAVVHAHSATISKLGKRGTDAVKARNSLLFLWRNIDDERLRREHRRWLPLVLAKRVACRDYAYLAGWRQAMARRRDAEEARRRDSRHRVLSDNEFFRTAGVEMG